MIERVGGVRIKPADFLLVGLGESMGNILVGKGFPHIQIKNMEVTVNYFTVHFAVCHETIRHYYVSNYIYLYTPPESCGFIVLFISDF